MTPKAIWKEKKLTMKQQKPKNEENIGMEQSPLDDLLKKPLYHLRKLQDDPKYTFELKTQTNCIIPINLEALIAITPHKKEERQPTIREAMMLANIVLGQGADPYAKECGLMPVYSGGFHYEPWVAAQVRIRKAQSQNDYDGYTWGWITKDFIRQESGRACKADPKEIIGAWGEVIRKEQAKPFYHEVFLEEYRKNEEKGSWGKTPLTMLAKVIRDQTHKFAYADKMGNLNTDDELRVYNIPEVPASDVAPRDERRKSLQDEVVMDRKPVSDTEGSRAADDAGDSKHPLDTNMEAPAGERYGSLLMEVTNTFKKLAKEAYGHTSNDVEFLKWANFFLGEEIEQITDLISPQLEQLKRELETNGVTDYESRS
jgi:hypothetical protein